MAADDTGKKPFGKLNAPNLGSVKAAAPANVGLLTKRKRSIAIGLLIAGTGAAAVYGLSHHVNCNQVPEDQKVACGCQSSAADLWAAQQSTCHYSSSSHSDSGHGSGSGGGFHFTSHGGFGGTGAAHSSGGS